MQKSTTVYLLRHAESAPSGDLPERDWPLTGLGQRQAQRLVEILSPLGIRKIFSSPYLRAIQTVRPFAKKSGLTIDVLSNLRERKLVSGFADNWSELVQKAWQDLNFRLPDGESGRECQQRIVTCLSDLVDGNRGKTVLTVSHGNAIGLFLNYLDSSFGFASWSAMTMPDLFRIKADGRAWSWEHLTIDAGS